MSKTVFQEELTSNHLTNDVALIPSQLLDVALASNLTNVEWLVWVYLQRMNKTTDIHPSSVPVYRKQPSISRLTKILGFNGKLIVKAINRLEQLGLLVVD